MGDRWGDGAARCKHALALVLAAGCTAARGPEIVTSDFLRPAGTQPEEYPAGAGELVRRKFSSGRCDDFAPMYGCYVTETLVRGPDGEPVAVLEHYHVYDPQAEEWRLWRTLRRRLGPARLVYPREGAGSGR